MIKNIKVLPFKGKWAIEEDGDIQVRIVHNSKHDAIMEAKKLARLYNIELSLQETDGNIYPVYL